MRQTDASWVGGDRQKARVAASQRNRARAVVRANQARIVQGRAHIDKEAMMDQEPSFVGIDVAKARLDGTTLVPIVQVMALEPPFLSVPQGGTVQAIADIHSFGLPATVSLALFQPPFNTDPMRGITLASNQVTVPLPPVVPLHRLFRHLASDEVFEAVVHLAEGAWRDGEG